ncbi:type 1 glutamine amidotransferase [Methanoculleus sp. FWC-SCC1]|uniref:Type 1 glutamine amidotransferase n=1 Tax=Methanoculleus frigidifontis TaxID=2584085 RepID=A0ABT8MDT9_9EURY|nr:type 1 glutamine amidotransferase domain-containing protein [Methanoculleus sp. FWC-SCC1]MDN7026104.1 type 1 glutamine amidotransferase [Methanoculleus sp. FWC-SCC1]
MSRIAVLITDGFEDVEYTKPAGAFADAGHTLVHVGLQAGETVRGKRSEASVRIDRAADAAAVDEFDALFIPGGYSPDRLRAHPEPVRFAQQFLESGKPVFAICHAPQLFITAQALRGRRVTGWRSIVQDIKNAGAEFVDAEVVVDRNLVSSRNPGDIPAFIDAALEMLETSGVRMETAEARSR